jgi:hypothetical protein
MEESTMDKNEGFGVHVVRVLRLARKAGGGSGRET